MSNPAPNVAAEPRSDLRSRRIGWIDVARGMGILLVVYGHVLRGLIAAGRIPASGVLWQTDYTIYAFHMPLFFMLAGLNVDDSIAKGKGIFLKSKLWTIAYPYLLWSIVQGSVQLLIPTYLNSPRSLSFVTNLLWHPIGQFWFLYVLFLCHMLALTLSRQKLLLAVCAFLFYGLSLSIANPFWSPILFMSPFYVLGIFLGGPVRNWRPDPTRAWAMSVLSALAFGLAVSFGRVASGGSVASVYSLPASLLGILFLCWLSQAVESSSQYCTRIFTTLGVMSMTIYILHVLAASGARVVLMHHGIQNGTVQLVLGTVAGVGLPMIAHLFFARLQLLPWLGLAPLRGRRPVTPRIRESFSSQHESSRSGVISMPTPSYLKEL